MKTNTNTKTYLLENDDYFRIGQEEFCKSIDTNYEIYCTSKRDSDPTDALYFAMYLSQPSVDTLISCSAFIYPGGQFDRKRFSSDLKESSQLHDFARLLLPVVRFKEKSGHKPLTIHIVYLTSSSFIKDVNDEIWGEDFKRLLCLIVRQNEEYLTINIYDEKYKFVHKLVESDFKL